MKIVNAAQMKEMELKAAEMGLPPSVLMEKAGWGVAREVRRLLNTAIGSHILILVGPGNNGGDGLVAARHLSDWGARVHVYLIQQRQEEDPNMELVLERGIPTLQASQDDNLGHLDALLTGADAVVDAVLGTGKARPLEGVMAKVLQKVSQARTRRPQLKIVAVDLPSGLNPDTGAVDSHCPVADVTVTLGYPKLGLFSFPGAAKVGQLRVADIGLPPSLGEGIALELMTPAWVSSILPHRPLHANKGTFGRVLVIAGSMNYIGAAYLACAGAARCGAGLVTLAAPQSLVPIVATKLTEVTYLPLPEEDSGTLASGATDILSSSSTYEVWLVGCGLGQSQGARELVERAILSGPTRAGSQPACLVLDADALNILAQIPNGWQRLPPGAILTPHPGEMARLAGLAIEDIQASRVEVARQMAQQWGQVVVLKGAYTVVAEPGGRVRLSPFVNPALASAGTGDVLAGAIAGLAAQGLSGWDAASCGVYLHGLAGEMVSQELGQAGPLASDLLPALPRAIKALKEKA